jgi:N-acetylglucosaminyldiphosphoundecaprenol N-acetyl-beta-D-mannosaminyltransferase
MGVRFQLIPRLASEPRRLWKRYLVTKTLFVWGVLRQLVFQRSDW